MKITVGELCEKLDILNSLEKMKMTESMQVYNPKAYPWNHAVGPHGNMGNISPFFVSLNCNKYGIPWYTYGSPNTSGIKVYCASDELWKKNLAQSKN